MNRLFTDEVAEVINAAHYRPAISVIMPFEIKIKQKAGMPQAFKKATNKVMTELNNKYPDEITALMMRKLNTIIEHCDYNTDKKSMVIYLSPVFEKVFYLDIPVEEKIIIDESFEVRDLVYSKKELHKFLVLCLTGKDSRLSVYDSAGFVKTLQTNMESIYAYTNEVPERVANFSDVSKRKEIVMGKYLNHIDASLDEIFKIHHLPVFVLGDKRMLGHFKKITRHADSIVSYIHGNYADTTLEELKNVLDPYIVDWKKAHQNKILHQLEAASDKKKLAVGISEVWNRAMNNKGKLLIVEKNYMCAAQHAARNDIIYIEDELHNTFSVINDAVDDVIEKVLKSGGEVEFVEDGNLADYQRIALIEYY